MNPTDKDLSASPNRAAARPRDAVIIRAGGTAKRLGGVAKPDYKIGNSRLSEMILAEIDRIGVGGLVLCGGFHLG